ncbi:ThuA domain-containing protein [Tunturiibacter gelidiferens]|uniref:ThuA domain-containing protein n=1 Tax=Tunturiibacter gelidiferens TaxID=3069689 RepID=UPI003D9AE114
MPRLRNFRFAALLMLAFFSTAPSRSQSAAPVRYRVIALAEAGNGLHQGFVDAALEFLEKTGAKEGFAVDYIRTTDPITDDYLAQHKLFVQLNYPPYRWTPVAEAAFKKAMDLGTIGYVGFHHATLLGKFDGFEMSPFFYDFMGRIQFKSYIPEFATGTVHVEAPRHPVMKGLPKSFVIENDEWYTYDRSPRPSVHVLANVDEGSYQPVREVKMGDHPVVWSNEHYKARNVYFQFGHHGELLGNANFQELFLNAIHWAAE